jgi:hypothetical protein
MNPLFTEAQIAEVLLRIEQAGEGYRIPLIGMAMTGQIVVTAACHGEPVEAQFLKQDRPTVILLTDDHPDATGPKRWKQIRRLLRWSNMVILHATGGHPDHYLMAVGSVIMTKRLLMVEMQHRHHAEWHALAMEYAPRTTVFSILPTPGQTHPREVVPEGTVIQ